MRRSAGDRRLKPRFEITGELGGTFETRLMLAVVNVGRGGVLAESPMSLAVGSQHQLWLHCDGIQAPAEVQVRHVRAAAAERSDEAFLIGFEFVTESPAVLEVLERWIALHGEATAGRY